MIAREAVAIIFACLKFPASHPAGLVIFEADAA
jgi:hypothetical protein